MIASAPPANTIARESPLSLLLRIPLYAGRLAALIFAVLLTLLVRAVFFPSYVMLEERLGSLGWTLSPDNSLEERIVVVAIDERSISEIGPWPWARETMAELTTAIDQAGAQLQLHDIVYSDPKAGDRALIQALSEAKGAVVAQVPVLKANSPTDAIQNVQVGTLSGALVGIDCNSDADFRSGFPSTESYIAAHSGFEGVAKGHIAPIVSLDGSISKQPAVVCIQGKAYPALAVAAVLNVADSSVNSESVSTVRLDSSGSAFDADRRLVFDKLPGFDVPLDMDGNLRISYAKSPSDFLAISAADVLAGSFDVELLDNAWVLVGATAFGLGDVVPTPYSGAAPGVELQARILASIVDAEVPFTPRSASWILALMCLFSAGIISYAASLTGRLANVALPGLFILLPTLALGLHAQLLTMSSVWLGWLFPATFSAVAAGAVFLLEQTRIRLQRNRVLANLSSYLPHDAAQQIAYSLPNSSISARRSQLTLLCADLRNFSAYSEARPPEESAAVLHFFFQRATQIVEKNKGRVHEFKGDSLLATWDSEGEELSDSAYLAGLEMVEQINGQLLEAFAPAGLEPLVVGVGIEQGPVLVGSIGPAHRRAHTLLGETVTIALRIQEMTADLAQPLLVGECAARQLINIDLESQGSYLLAGLKNPHVLFAPASTKSKKAELFSMPKLKVFEGGRANKK